MYCFSVPLSIWIACSIKRQFLISVNRDEKMTLSMFRLDVTFIINTKDHEVLEALFPFLDNRVRTPSLSKVYLMG